MAERDDVESVVQRCYATWGTTYYEDYYGPSASYPPVHRDLLRRQLLAAGVRTLLDAGCGPASFLRELGGIGIDLYGFDLTAEMVEEGRRVLGDRGLAGDRIWQGSVLDPAAFRHRDRATFDAISCVGVMPHIPAQDEPLLLANLRGALAPEGLLLLEARNQLFALFTVNRYSYELVTGELVRADALRGRAGADLPKLESALAAMQAQFRMDLPPRRQGTAGTPGYDEILSRTHNPFVLKEQVAAAGFRDVRLLFYHYHALPPLCAPLVPELFARESLAMEDPTDWRGHFMASAFVVEARKA